MMKRCYSNKSQFFRKIAIVTGLLPSRDPETRRAIVKMYFSLITFQGCCRDDLFAAKCSCVR